MMPALNSVETARRYDELLYPGFPFSQTHPDRQSTLARLFGMSPAPVENCRVLELGCADGGNLIPMAYELPGSAFVGLDLGARAIARGCARIAALGLRNIQLHRADILDAGPALGPFDYVIAHGVYSWVPQAVRTRILELCRETLAPHGTAFISYDAYPGAHLRAMLADMLQYRVRGFAEAGLQVEQARLLTALLCAWKRDESDPYAAVLQHESEHQAARLPTSFYHDALQSEYRAFYFHQFAHDAAAHGLQYLAEADFFEMYPRGQAPEAVAALDRMSAGAIDREQLLDFLKCRRFRQTLLCRAEVPLRRAVHSSSMRRFFVSATPGLAAGLAGRTAAEIAFEGVLPPTQAARQALVELASAYPRRLAFDELRDAVALHGGGGDPDEISDALLAGYAAGLLETFTRPGRFVTEPGERPRVSLLARLEARDGTLVTSLRHASVALEEETGRTLLQALDGTRDRAQLAERLASLLGADTSTVAAHLEDGLRGLARHGLLEA